MDSERSLLLKYLSLMMYFANLFTFLKTLMENYENWWYFLLGIGFTFLLRELYNDFKGDMNSRGKPEKS